MSKFIDHLLIFFICFCSWKSTGLQKQLYWIQSSLLTLCSARLGTYAGQEFRQPIACLSIKMNTACPIVPWTEMEANGLRSEAFLFLLHRLGLLLPGGSPVGLYPRIPFHWDTDTLYSVALLLGPVDQERVDFDLALVRKVQAPFVSADVTMEGQSFLFVYYLSTSSFSILSASHFDRFFVFVLPVAYMHDTLFSTISLFTLRPARTYSDLDFDQVDVEDLNELIYRLPYEFPASSAEIGCTAVSWTRSLDFFFGNATPLDALGRAKWFPLPVGRNCHRQSESPQQQQQQPPTAR